MLTSDEFNVIKLVTTSHINAFDTGEFYKFVYFFQKIFLGFNVNTVSRENNLANELFKTQGKEIFTNNLKICVIGYFYSNFLV